MFLSSFLFPRLGLGLLKDTHNLALELRKFHRENSAARVQDEVEARGQKIDMAAQSLAHAALDAVALVSLAHDFAYGEADARRGGSTRAFSCCGTVCGAGARNQLIAAECRLRPAA